MPKLGRPLPDKEERIKAAVFASLSDNVPGRTLGELTEDLKRAIGVDRTTVWRHLKRFKKSGIVIHEGKFYRKNPIYGMEERTSNIDGPGSRTISSMKKTLECDYWNPKNHDWGDKTPLDSAITLAKILTKELQIACELYMLTLESVGRAPNLSAAREIAYINFDSQVRGPLMAFGRRFWEQRDKASQALRDLEKKPLDITFRL